MGKLVVYTPLVVAVLLPVLFRRIYAVRVLSAFLLCAVAGIHYAYLLAAHRLIREAGAKEFAIAPGNSLPREFDIAVDLIQDSNHRQMELFVAIIVAFAILGLLPIQRVTGPVSNVTN
jgi:hypothetical protein